MTWLKRFNPTPAFPAHTGPHKVGSIDIEIPTSQLDSPSANAPPADLPTVAFRVFYPCKQESEQKAVKWIPSPQREYISAYAKFLGANSAFAGVFSLLPQLLYYSAMPVHQNADILQPSTQSKRWPVMMFSHGLGGSRNAYSSICGSLASHGIIVVAPDHRDGSAPLSIHRIPELKEKVKRVEYRPVSHKASTEVYEARDEQLRIRMWELGMIHDALLKIDGGKDLKNVAQDHTKKDGVDVLSMFSNLLNIHEPGAITFAGHSFGACTMVQFVKSVYYRHDAPAGSSKSLFTPTEDSKLVRQITPANPVALLDLWTLPIQSPDAAWLRANPMPCYDAPAGGKNLISILSESFYKWSANYSETRNIVAKPPAAQSKYPDQAGAHIFYPIASAHLSQSDFGVLFPWVTTKVFGAKEPERVLRLNTRAVLQVLRESGIEVSDTSVQDLELEGAATTGDGAVQDSMILSRSKDVVRGWVNLGGESEGSLGVTRTGAAEKVDMGPGEAMMEGEALGQVVEANHK